MKADQRPKANDDNQPCQCGDSQHLYGCRRPTEGQVVCSICAKEHAGCRLVGDPMFRRAPGIDLEQRRLEGERHSEARRGRANRGDE